MSFCRIILLKRPSCLFASAKNLSSTILKSDLHPENLYPGSSSSSRLGVAKLNSVDHPSGFNGEINIKEVDFNYEHTDENGIPTKVSLRFHLDSVSWLTDDVKKTLRTSLSSHISKNGYILVASDRTRSQLLNQADAMHKLRHLIWNGLDPHYKTRLEKIQEKELLGEIKRKELEKAARLKIAVKKTDRGEIN